MMNNNTRRTTDKPRSAETNAVTYCDAARRDATRRDAAHSVELRRAFSPKGHDDVRKIRVFHCYTLRYTLYRSIRAFRIFGCRCKTLHVIVILILILIVVVVDFFPLFFSFVPLNPYPALS